MKNILILSAILLTAHLGICQTVSVPSGVVGTSSNSFMGIGTSTPTENLTISNNGNVYVGIEKPAYSNKLLLGISSHSGILNYSAGDPLNSSLYLRTNNINRLTISDSGKIGIGTINPDTKFHIEGTSSTYSRIANSGGDTRLTFGAVTGRNIIYSHTFSGEAQTFKLQVNNENNFVINTNGSIGIGTMTTGSHKLAIEGSIGAREIVVETDTWSDFVFDKDYELKDLNEVENFIQENNHLPDIPSEKEVLENGVALGEMDAKLLQKIEELTLYMIEQNKIMKAQNEEIQKLKERINTLEAQ